MRQLLAGATIRALEGRGPTFMQQFDERVAALEALAASPDSHSAYVAASVALTLDLANASGNERLAQIMLSLARQSSRYTQVALSRPQRRKESARNWRSVVKALAANRTIEASLAMEKLVDDARREAVKTLESGETASKRSTT
ncbi:MAG TPA: FCD domain-containing protein [Alicycliphilus sp.]|nr:FCD domain-containing protein [Alicycliphilus sp.]